MLVDHPGRKGRLAIIKVHIGGVKLAADVNLDVVASLTVGLTGADLENLINEAALLATRRGGTQVTLADFAAAIERIVAGLEKRSRLLTEAERRRVAYHDRGHALLAATLPGVDSRSVGSHRP